MTFYENSSLERGLDTMFMVYSLLDGHPASTACEQFITSRQGWVNTPLLVIEGMAIMIKVYGVEPEIACQLVTDFAYGPISILPIELETITAAVDLSILHDVDINDAVLLQACIERGIARIATDDRRFAHACANFGIIVENPITPAIRQQMAAWEAANLPPRGLPRLLTYIHQWLKTQEPNIATKFYEATGQYLHLP